MGYDRQDLPFTYSLASKRQALGSGLNLSAHNRLNQAACIGVRDDFGWQFGGCACFGHQGNFRANCQSTLGQHGHIDAAIRQTTQTCCRWSGRGRIQMLSVGAMSARRGLSHGDGQDRRHDDDAFHWAPPFATLLLEPRPKSHPNPPTAANAAIANAPNSKAFSSP